MNSIIRPAVRTGTANSSSTLVTSTFQTKIGMRISVMPGARILKIVAMKLIAPRMELKPSSMSASEPQVDAGAALFRQRRVDGPAGVGRAADGVTGEEQQAAERDHPERQRVDAREGHVRGADLERDDVVREAGHHRHHEQEDHRRAVHREELVVRLGVQELDARARPARSG